MAALEIPTLTDGTHFYSQRNVLEGVQYLLTFKFNARRDRWQLTLATLDGVEVVTGQTIVTGVDLLRRSVSPAKPPGTLAALAIQGDQGDPRLLDLGDRVRLYYNEAE